jgi:hypothetical protein
VDLNELLHRHQVSLMQRDRAESAEERRAHTQFASDFAEEIQTARDELGAPAQLRAPPDHAACVTFRVVLMPSDDAAYTVVIACGGDELSRHSFATMQEAETFIRTAMPSPAPRSTLYDRESGEI